MMASLAHQSVPAAEEAPVRASDTRPIPRITIQAFCDSPEIAGIIETAATDRRMARAHVKVHTGGISAAAEFYRSAPTPNLIVIESRLQTEEYIAAAPR
jgi:pilus assembly protein CpaE